MYPGSKKFIKIVAAVGITKSRIKRMENIQNIPKSALGNLIAAAANAFSKPLSREIIIARETIQCAISNT